MSQKGKIIIFSAPSGSGKTTIVKYLLAQGFNMEFSISATSRSPRGEEKDGVDYYFLSVEEFKKRIANNEFVEFEEVYSGTYYGTLKCEVERITSKGKNIVFDVDVVGGVNIKNLFGDQALALFIQPPSIDVLKNRLISRGTDSMDMIEMRIAKAEEELSYAPKFDYVIINDDLSTAQLEAVTIFNKFLETN